jgi:hypothetical protein
MINTGTIFFDPVTIVSKYFNGNYDNNYIQTMYKL